MRLEHRLVSLLAALSASACIPDPGPNGLVVDFTSGSFDLASFANARGASSTFDPRGATRVAYSSAGPHEFTGVEAPGPWDLSRSDLFALDVGFDTTTTLTRIVVFFCFDEGDRFDNYASQGDLLVGVAKPRRLNVPIPRASLEVHGTANWANVKRVEIRLVPIEEGADHPDAMYLYGLIANVSSRPQVILAFDDGNASVYALAYPLMSAARIPGTLYLNGHSIGDTPTKMTLRQVRELYAAGWDVANHTIDHSRLTQPGMIERSDSTATFTVNNPSVDAIEVHRGDLLRIQGADQPEYDGPQVVTGVIGETAFTFRVAGTPRAAATGWISTPLLQADVIRSKIVQQTEWMLQNGFTRALEHFAYPQGYFDDEVVGVLRDLGFKTARTVNVEPFSTFIWPNYSGLADPYHIPALTLFSATRSASVLADVDAAIAVGASLHIYGHGVADAPASTEEMPTAEFAALVDGLRSRRDAGLLDVETISTWRSARTP